MNTGKKKVFPKLINDMQTHIDDRNKQFAVTTSPFFFFLLFHNNSRTKFAERRGHGARRLLKFSLRGEAQC